MVLNYPRPRQQSEPLKRVGLSLWSLLAVVPSKSPAEKGEQPSLKNWLWAVGLAAIAACAANSAASEPRTGSANRLSGVSMCVECDALNAQLRIVRDKIRSFEEGRALLANTRRELAGDAAHAERFANAYVALQGSSIAVGVATLPCSIPLQWLKGLIGGAAGLGSLIQEGNPGEATLAGIVGFVGLGVLNDAMSLSEFATEYREGKAGVMNLDRHIQATMGRFDETLGTLRREKRRLTADLSRGGCEEGDSGLPALLRRAR